MSGPAPRPGDQPRWTTRFARSTETARRRLLGLTFFLVVALFVWLCIAVYNKDFSSAARVELVTDTIGNTLPDRADVKIRGLTVGYVKSSATKRGRVTSLLELQPGALPRIPSNVTARLLPKTLFGERYVSLVVPAAPSPVPLAAGMVIYQDRSGNALELSRLFDDLLPLITAIPPQDLSAALGATSEALADRGAELGTTLDRLDHIFGRTNRYLPDLQEDLRSLAVFADTYAVAAPELIDTLDNLRTTNATVIQRRADVDRLIHSVIPTAHRTADFLAANSDNIIDVTADTRETLTLLATYSPTFPCAMRNFAIAVPRINAVLGQGTNMPGARTAIKFVNPRGRYLPNQDEPRWFDTRGPQCEPAPPNGVDPGQYPGGAINDGSYQPPTRNPGNQHIDLPPAQFSPAPPPPAAALVTAPATGLESNVPTVADSAAEHRTLASVYSAATGLSPRELPVWAMEIGAPALRGSAVTIPGPLPNITVQPGAGVR